MPSPIAHAAAGYLIGRHLPISREVNRRAVILAGVGLSLLPDMDAALGLMLGDIGRYHNHMMSSPLFAVLVSLGIGLIGWRLHSAFRLWFKLTLACYLTHITMDFMTDGRGIMLVWPFTETRFKPPLTIFYGLHWSDGLYSHRHVWTMITEVGTIAALALLLRIYRYLLAR